MAVTLTPAPKSLLRAPLGLLGRFDHAGLYHTTTVRLGELEFIALLVETTLVASLLSELGNALACFDFSRAVYVLGPSTSTGTL